MVANRPAEHTTQLVESVAPTTAEVLPAGQLPSQVAAPPDVVYCPAAHCVHRLEPLGAKLPGPQLRHMDMALAPVFGA